MHVALAFDRDNPICERNLRNLQQWRHEVRNTKINLSLHYLAKDRGNLDEYPLFETEQILMSSLEPAALVFSALNLCRGPVLLAVSTNVLLAKNDFFNLLDAPLQQTILAAELIELKTLKRPLGIDVGRRELYTWLSGHGSFPGQQCFSINTSTWKECIEAMPHAAKEKLLESKSDPYLDFLDLVGSFGQYQVMRLTGKSRMSEPGLPTYFFSYSYLFERVKLEITYKQAIPGLSKSNFLLPVCHFALLSAIALLPFNALGSLLFLLLCPLPMIQFLKNGSRLNPQKPSFNKIQKRLAALVLS